MTGRHGRGRLTISGRLAAAAACLIMAGMALGGCNEAPMTFMRTFGASARPVERLGWGLGLICSLVVVIIAALLLAAVLKQRERSTDVAGLPAVGRSGSGLRWITVGVAISTVVLFGCIVWTLTTLAAVASPRSAPAFTLQVTGHQWWWEVRYIGSAPDRTFTTANDIHIPVGKPVRLELIGADVIHSFWVPALAGKTDVIPGQTNVSWFEADKAGVYRGQCTEYCGKQHAHMALTVTADAPAQFEAWWDRQLQSATPPSSAEAADGMQVFAARCGACHSVRGTGAGGILGPDLSHLASRETLAAGTLPNDPGHLGGWIADPQGVKPGARMPRLDLSGPELAHVLAYLETLK